jgi:hypothetical protein
MLQFSLLVRPFFNRHYTAARFDFIFVVIVISGDFMGKENCSYKEKVEQCGSQGVFIVNDWEHDHIFCSKANIDAGLTIIR